MKNTVAVALILVAAALGFAHGASRFRSDYEAAKEEAIAARRRLRDLPEITGPTETKTEPAKPSTPAPPPTPAKGAPEPPPAAPPPAKQVSPEDRKKAVKTIAEAEQAHKRGMYKEEIALTKQAVDLVKEGDDVESMAVRKLAQKMVAKAKVFACLKDYVAPNEFADGKNLTRVSYFGRDYIVRVVSRDATNVVMKRASGVEITLKKVEIEKAETCSPEEWRGLVEKGLEERVSKVDDQSALELYAIAYYCLENGLGAERAAPWLEKAWDRDEAGILVETFCTSAERPSKEDVLLARGDKARRPSRPVAPATPGTSTRGEEPGGAEPATAAPSGADAAVLADARFRKAMSLLEQGRQHYRASYTPADQETQTELKAASKIFDEVFDLIRQMQEQFPESDELGARLQEITLIRADCHKRTKVAR